MKVSLGNLLKKFRKNNNQVQEDVYRNTLSKSSYSRIETDTQPLFVQSLSGELNNLSISGEEFLIYSNIDNEQNHFLKLFNDCQNNLNSSACKEKLLAYYSSLKQKDAMTLREKSNYITIKCSFANLWTEIDRVAIDEVADYYYHLKNRQVYTQYDYSLFRNMTLYFTDTQVKELVYKMFPLSNENKSNVIVLNYVSHIFQNLITFRIYERDFDSAIKYLELAQIQKIEKTNYYYWLNINYLEELIAFVKEGNFNSFDKIRHYINVIEDLGHEEQAVMLKNEVTRLMNGEKIKPQEDIPVVATK